MLCNEQIAHDLALIWVNNSLAGRLPPLTQGKHLVEEYLAAYTEALKKLEAFGDQSSPQIDQAL